MDKQIDILKQYWPNDQLKKETPYLNGLKHGMVQAYYPNGNVYYKTPYINGKCIGMEISWYENGIINDIRIWKQRSKNFYFLNGISVIFNYS